MVVEVDEEAGKSFLNFTFCPRPYGIIKISEKIIDASRSYRFKGCRVIWVAFQVIIYVRGTLELPSVHMRAHHNHKNGHYRTK